MADKVTYSLLKLAGDAAARPHTQKAQRRAADREAANYFLKYVFLDVPYGVLSSSKIYWTVSFLKYIFLEICYAVSCLKYGYNW